MNPKTVRIVAVVVVVVLVVAGIGVYYVLTRPPACGLKSSNPLIFDQAETADSPDPAVTFTTPGWALVQQVYQGLVNYNGSSYTNFSGVLAKNWSSSPDHMHWNFSLRSGVHFSNGDAFNAYVMWFSLYRSLLMNQGPQFILSQNFFSPDVSYYSNITNVTAANQTLVNELDHWSFSSPTSSEIAIMEAPNQSFQVINNLTLELNLGFGYLGVVPYTYLLATLSAPNSYAVDPAAIQANGGVVESQTNNWTAVNMLGTGQYTLEGTYNPASNGYTLVPDPNYWGTTSGWAAREPSNPMIQPAQRTIQINYQQQLSTTEQDLQTGGVAGASFAYLGTSDIQTLKTYKCLTVQAMPTVFGATSGSWWIYLNQSMAPFNNWSVRAAVAHAINYTQVIDSAFGGYADRWVGPVPPSYPYYNPGGLAPYSYDLSLARQEMANSPWPNGYPGTLNFEYVNTPSFTDMATLVQADLAAIGITINPEPIPLSGLYQEQTVNSNGQCPTNTTFQGGPFPLGLEFYTSDYISPDDWTQNNAYTYGSANQCMAGYSNATMDGLVFGSAATADPTLLAQNYTLMTKMMYDNYTDVWLVVPTSFAVYNNELTGFVQNPMASAEPFALLFNGDHT